MTRVLQPILAGIALLLPTASHAVPHQLAHQGELSDTDGPVTDTLEVTFRLYDAEVGGSEVWVEARTVDVVDGLYTALLGTETPVAQVLADEPALWLEITVEDGAPLLPRRPVASAPYAILADTAVNLDGGTVNASSLSVNGTAVVDGDGDWVGPAGSIDWSTLGGLPAGLDDGDADTLGGLSCADGDRAVWDDTASLWACGSATVTLDRLDLAGALAGDVLTYDGVDAAWTDVVAAGGCGLAVVSERVSELTCGPTTVRVRTPGEYIAITGPQDTVRLRASGAVTVVGGAAIPAPSGAYVGLSRGAGFYYCAIDGTGALTCQGSRYDYGFNPSPTGSFTDVACSSGVANGYCCGVLTSGTATCWDFRNAGYAPSPTGGGFVQVAVTDHGACARTGGGEVTCWNSPISSYDLVANTPPLLNVDQLAWRGVTFQAVTAWGDVDAWSGSAGSDWSSSVPPGNYIASSSTAVFIRDDGLAVSRESGSSGLYYFEGSYVGGGSVFLVRADGTLGLVNPAIAGSVD